MVGVIILELVIFFVFLVCWIIGFGIEVGDIYIVNFLKFFDLDWFFDFIRGCFFFVVDFGIFMLFGLNLV